LLRNLLQDSATRYDTRTTFVAQKNLVCHQPKTIVPCNKYLTHSHTTKLANSTF